MRIENLLLNNKIKNKVFSIVDDFGEWDSTSLCKRVIALRDVLLINGVKHLDKVAVICDNGASFIIAIMGALAAGCIVVPIDPQLPISDVFDILHGSETRRMCISGVRSEVNYSKKRNEDVQIFSENLGEWESDETLSKCFQKIQNYTSKEPAFILFSSGTSGTRKGVVLTHDAISTNVDAIIDYMIPKSNDIFYITKSMIHASTLVGEVLVALKIGARVIAQNPIVPLSTTLKRIATFRPSIIFVNPTILRLLLKAKSKYSNVESIRLVYVSGEVADGKLLAEAEQFFYNGQVHNVYGLTEAGPRVAAQRVNNRYIKHGSVGKPIRGVSIAIKNKNGVRCKCNEIGMIYVKTRSAMLQYWNDDVATCRKYFNGWLMTGDLGYMDNEGDLFIVGRADDIIIRGAHKIDPYRVESIIKRIPGIDSCIVFGIQDQIQGNRVICIYLNDEGVSVDTDTIMIACRESLALYEIPQELYSVKKIPTTLGGKVSRRLAISFYYKHLLKN
ncbi:class I adenylate-forming enzyme family protein [Pelosinus fermentans]|uniref:O-succinylbenzoate--CoA ligase n=1 Tax=Pelosinus fermentans JBW45 TaxID=1192197 RepID=I8TV52_9FIRM|nr:class I adenylate-forming enzyme family protein [Pelosinus fermentans]AJQ26586.1 o-succinylbenzoate--CoA ligase [Pelosinus fermentans JBW45]